MTDEEFSRYCAEVMGYKPNIVGSGYEYKGGFIAVTSQKQSIYFKPNTDLNQMAEVFDKLMCVGGLLQNHERFTEIFNDREPSTNKGIAQAMRQFIESTKEES